MTERRLTVIIGAWALAIAAGCLFAGCGASVGNEGGDSGPPGDGIVPTGDGVKPCSGASCPCIGNDCPPTGPSTGWGYGKPFPTDPKIDPNVKDTTGVKYDPAAGGLVLDKAMINFNYLWIANTYDLGGSADCVNPNDSTLPVGANPARCRGSVSKVDTVAMKEVARYFSVTCAAKGGATGCQDVNGLPIKLAHRHTPSRTAVDFNFDVWVANRSVFGGQPSATKIANDPADCVDRNKNGKIDTSKDQDGDGKINPDCDGDGLPDSVSTKCTNGLPPEFLGDDDECILFTTNYAEENDIGRSICLDTGKNNVGASNAWVGTFSRPENGRGNNRFYGINGSTGKIETTVDLPAGHHTYGCMADSSHIVWATDIYGSLTYFSTRAPFSAGPLMRAPWYPKAGAQFHHYGISINFDQHVWLGGYDANWVLRYKPDRTSFDTLSKGTWTRVDLPKGFITRGVAADNRGKVWVAIQDGGYIFRLEQSLPDGVHDKTGAKLGVDYWQLGAQTVIGTGVDFNGNIWAGGHTSHTVSRLDVDAQGNVITPATGTTKNVTIGKNPYTYSDFTGYGLINFVRPSGRYVYQHTACTGGTKPTWTGVVWKGLTPTGTSISLRVRTGDSDTTFGSWSPELTTSPANIGPKAAAAITPNPATTLQVEFTLKNTQKDTTPVLQGYAVTFSCGTPS